MRERIRFANDFGGESRTKQSMRDETDINLIMRRFQKTGVVSHLVTHGADYGYASELSFHEAMNIVAKGEQMFADLPAALRKRFGNDPGTFLSFVQDPGNLDELRELGLAKPAPVARAPMAIEIQTRDAEGRFGPMAPAPKTPGGGTVAT